MAQTRVFSLLGQTLKLETRADLEAHLNDLDIENVEEIILGGNTFGVEASLALAEILKKARKLKIANFADIFTGRLISEIPTSLTAICDALKDHTSLIELNLSDNAFGGRSADPLVPFLTTNRSLQVLKINNNGLGPSGGMIISDALLKAAETLKKEGKTSNLRTVICGRNRLENGSAPNWAKAFAAHGTLEEVKMPQNGIRMEGITALAEGLSKCPNLRSLDFQDNVASESGCDALAQAIPSWPNLTSLNLSDCVLTPEGGLKLIGALSSTSFLSKLEVLSLQNAELDDSAIESLKEKLEAANGLHKVKRLELQYNDNDPEAEVLEEISDIMKARGGKVIYTSDDEEEDEEEEEGEAGEEVAEKAPDGTRLDTADELAAMLENVKIS